MHVFNASTSVAHATFGSIKSFLYGKGGSLRKLFGKEKKKNDDRIRLAAGKPPTLEDPPGISTAVPHSTSHSPPQLTDSSPSCPTLPGQRLDHTLLQPDEITTAIDTANAIPVISISTPNTNIVEDELGGPEDAGHESAYSELETDQESKSLMRSYKILLNGDLKEGDDSYKTKTDSSNTPLSILRSLVEQLAWSPDGSKISELVEGIYQRETSKRNLECPLSIPDCLNLLVILINVPQPTAIILDGLGECTTPNVLLWKLADAVIVRTEPEKSSYDIRAYITCELERKERRNETVIDNTFSEWIKEMIRMRRVWCDVKLSHRRVLSWLLFVLPIINIARVNRGVADSEIDNHLSKAQSDMATLSSHDTTALSAYMEKTYFCERDQADRWENVSNFPSDGFKVQIMTITFLTCCVYGFEQVMVSARHIEGSIGYHNHNGLSGLALAAQYGNLGVLKLLLEHGIRDTCEANSGTTALHPACLRGDLEVVEWLLQNHPKDSLTPYVNAVDDHDRTALYVAVENNQHQIVGLLLKEPGINLRARGRKGNTALDLAWRISNDLYELLRSHIKDEKDRVNDKPATMAALYRSFVQGAT
ncbi:hypothetical protein G7Y89_g15339 [Cudoniella acicularis]|uniref:Nephrocystin 3-like N-terminal domain-containing protein n=1 Tax=Cudoniella acicularis TaxID=354080 RepID=A0A8H4VLL2_9HELO|nr:hypothetical protein G7Y89_g15339 [Cudoniella acicularis]